MESIVIQSVEEDVKKIEAFIDSVCSENNCYNYFGTISMAVLQAVENAIIHGNNSNPQKTVSVECAKIKGGIAFTVEDEGSGFDFKKYSELPQNGDKGVGLFLMQTLSDTCQFFEGGKKIKMTFQIQGIETSKAIERTDVLTKFFQKQGVTI